jgi:hypothetical protein
MGPGAPACGRNAIVVKVQLPSARVVAVLPVGTCVTKAPTIATPEGSFTEPLKDWALMPKTRSSNTETILEMNATETPTPAGFKTPT